MNKIILIGMLLLAATLVIAACGQEDEPFLAPDMPVPPPSPIPYNEADLRLTSTSNEMNAVVVLARFSTEDNADAGQRADAASELIMHISGSDADSQSTLDLLNTIAPGASINDRREAAKNLAALSDAGGLTPEQYPEAANEVARLITGNALNAEQRIDAANELATRLNEGELDGASALELVNTIAPETSVKARAEALHALATEFNEDEWDEEKAMEFANELNKLATGEDLNVEESVDATVDISVEALKVTNRIVDDGVANLDDGEIDESGKVIKAVLKGDTESVKDLVLDTDAPQSSTGEANEDSVGFSYCELALSSGCVRTGYRRVEDKYISAFKRILTKVDSGQEAYGYALVYVEQREQGKSHIFAHHFAYLNAIGLYSREYAYHFAEQREQGKSELNAHIYASFRERGESHKYAVAYLHYILYAGDKWSEQNMFPSSSGDRYAIEYAELVDSGKSYQYAYYYLTGTRLYFSHMNLGDDYREFRYTYAENYAQQREQGKSHGYASFYAYAYVHAYIYAAYHAEERAQDRPHEYASAYAVQIADGKSHEYAVTYAEQVAEGRSHEESYLQAEQEHIPDSYHSALAQQIAQGKSHRYAATYAEQLEQGKSHQYAVTYAEQLEQGKSHRYAVTYAEQLEQGESHQYAAAYANKYAGLMAIRADHASASASSSTYAAAFVSGYSEQLQGGKSHEYAEIYAGEYAHERVLGHDHSSASTYAAAFVSQYSKQREQGKSRQYAIKYAIAYDFADVSVRVDPEYAELRAQGKLHEYVAAYAEQIAEGRSHREAEEAARATVGQ